MNYTAYLTHFFDKHDCTFNVNKEEKFSWHGQFLLWNEYTQELDETLSEVGSLRKTRQAKIAFKHSLVKSFSTRRSSQQL